MPQSLHRLSTHIVFSTKNRARTLTPIIRPKLCAYLSGVLRHLECDLPTVNGVEDHVHVLCNLTKKLPLIKVMEILKKESSKWIKTQPGITGTFQEEFRRILRKYGVAFDEKYVWD